MVVVTKLDRDFERGSRHLEEEEEVASKYGHARQVHELVHGRPAGRGDTGGPRVQSDMLV